MMLQVKKKVVLHVHKSDVAREQKMILHVKKIMLHVNKNDVTSEQTIMLHAHKNCVAREQKMFFLANFTLQTQPLLS
jgi:hypothetical protein